MPPLFDLMSSGNSKVNQVLIELHDHHTSPEILYNFFLAADRAKLRITHKERNRAVVRCVEYSFVSESFLREVNGAIICPSLVLSN